MDDVVPVDRDYGFHKRQERMNSGVNNRKSVL